jgi:hypothetical protein
MLPNPGENLEAVHAWEFELEDDEGGKGIFGTVREMSIAAEVGEGFFAGVGVVGRVRDGSFLKSPLEEEDVILSIFNDQD